MILNFFKSETHFKDIEEISAEVNHLSEDKSIIEYATVT